MPSCFHKVQFMNRTVLLKLPILSGGHAIFLSVKVYSAYPSVAAMLWRCTHIARKCLMPLSQVRYLRDMLMLSKNLYGEEVVVVSTLATIRKYPLNVL